MFYSTQVLARKGPLGVVWLAAHMDGKLKKNNVFEANLVGSVDCILNPEVPLALRLSGQLLLGVVNIYKKKVLYLYEDCNDAMSKMQQAFKPGAPVLQNGGKAAPMQITLPEDFDYGSLHHFDEEEFNRMTFEYSQPLELAVSSKDSLIMADDGAMFGTPMYNYDEQFENDEEELERALLSMGSKERLRDAGTPQVQRLFDDAVDASPWKGGDEMPEDVPMDGEMFMAGELGPPPSAPPSSHRDSEAAPLGLTPAEGEAMDPLIADDDLPFPSLEVADSIRKPKRNPAPVRLAAGEKRKRAVRDVDAKGQPATVIPTSSLRALMADRTPLMKARKKLTAAYLRSRRPRDDLHVANYSKAAEDSWVMRPGMTEMMAPAMYAVYLRRLGDDNSSVKRSKHQAAAPDQEVIEDAPVDSHQRDAAQEGGTLPSETAVQFDDAVGPEFPEDPGFDMEMPEGEGTAMEPFTAFQEGDDLAASPMPSDKRPSSSRKRAERGFEVEEEEADEELGSPSSKQEFTSRTQQVLKQVKSKLKGVTDRSGKKQRLHGIAAEGVDFNELHSGGSRTEAARLFFELLVLQSRSKVMLHQDEPYGTISVTLPARQ